MLYKVRRILPTHLKRSAKNFGRSILETFLNAVEPLTGTFFTFSTRPMYTAQVWIDPKETPCDYSDFAIVMQGPINTRNDFTLETLKLYKKYFNNALIILSTWEHEEEDTVEAVKRIGVEVILNKKPPNTGRLNINMQLTTARAGLERALKMGKKFAMKTRTDQRIYNRGSLSFLSNLLLQFPLTLTSSKQRGRLMALGAYDHRVKPKYYHVFDNLIFGHTEDVLMYFGADLIPNDHEIEFLKKDYPNDPYTAEIYLLTEFLKKAGHTLKYTPEDHVRAITHHCILIDGRALGWYWLKYRRELEFQIYDMTYRKRGNLSFLEWLNSYNQLKKENTGCCAEDAVA